MEKMLRHRRMGFLVLAGSAILAVAIPAQPTRSRNALVARADQTRGPVPAECEQGLSPTPALRVEVAELSMPAPAEPVEAPAPPPSGSLRAALQETQIALTRNDRPAFDAARERTKSLLANYPTGGERRAAEEVVRLHDAAARLWDAQYQSPFFGEDDPLYATVSAWPGYAEAVRRSVLTDDDERRFYPAAESRDFVTRLAGERLQRLGFTTPTRVTRNEPRATPTPRATTPRVTTPRTTTSRSTTSRTTKPRTTHVTRSASKPAKPSKPAPVTHAPGKPNPSAPPTTAAVPAPAPVALSQAKTDTPPSPVAGDVATTEPAPVPTSTAPTTTAEATTDTSATFVDTALSTDVIPATPKPVPGRSVILPTILILIGLGVLIVLFRASK